MLEDGDYSLDGCGGVEGDADVAAEFANFPGDGNGIGGDFDVESDVVGAGLDDWAGVAKRIGDHEVSVEVNLRGFADAFDHGRAEGDVGDEVAVHHVQVQIVAAGG